MNLSMVIHKKWLRKHLEEEELAYIVVMLYADQQVTHVEYFSFMEQYKVTGLSILCSPNISLPK